MDSSDENEEFYTYKGVPGTVVLINAFNPSKSEAPRIGYQATTRLIKHYLRQASNHYVGVCFYGTDETDASNLASQNITEIVPLSLLNLDDYNKLINSDIANCKQAKELIMSDALWHCSKMFANCKKQLLSKTILMLTSLDTPPIASDHTATFNRVMELVEFNIEIKVINIANADYEPDDFYRKFLINVWRSKDIVMPKTVWNYKEIEDMMFKQSHRHLVNKELCFEIGEGFEIGVGVYSLLKSIYQPKRENLDRDTNTIVTGVNKTLKMSIEKPSTDPMSMDVDESESKPLPLLKSEIIWSVEYGGEKIYVTDKEKKLMANPFGLPNLKLLGFKPAHIMCKEKWFLKQGYFLYPSENKIEGSTVAFKALHTACKNSSVVAICVLCPRENARPHMVALSPCKRPLNLDIEVGFDVIIVPFKENVRALTIEETDNPQVPLAHKTTMKNIINQLKFDYKPDTFENPKLQCQYKAIEAIALRNEIVEPFIDTTKPDSKRFDNLQEDLFEEIFGPFGAVATKRTGTRDTAANSKKTKVEDIDETVLNHRINSNQLRFYTVVQLKNILQSKTIPDLPDIKFMRKADLIDLVSIHFGKQ
jgi:ATP-dependent DNA helicase 2 subunit 1